MITDKFGQLIFDETDLCNFVMQGRDICEFQNLIVEPSVQLPNDVDFLDQRPKFVEYQPQNLTLQEWDQQQQSQWHMPDEYKNLDIAKHVLSLCKTEAELQRCGAELLLFQERGLFDLLKYLKYLVDVMSENHVIWGLGRGSSVASYVLYKLGVHRIDSLYYNLDIEEFLR